MRWKERDGIQWLEFELLADIPQITHGIFLRTGGYSSGKYASLNLSDWLGDDITNVEANRKKVSETLGIQELFWMKQCHSKQVHEIKNATKQQLQPQHLLEGDALTTSLEGIGLLITHGDCQAAIFYDPIRHVVANVHSGWRGSVQNIYAEVIAFLRQTYRSNPADLLVCISPSLGPQDAEFVNYRTELPESFWKFQIKPNYFDFWAISQDQLQQCGVLPHHIEIAGISTIPNPEGYFSYRRDKVTGRNGTVVALNKR